MFIFYHKIDEQVRTSDISDHRIGTCIRNFHFDQYKLIDEQIQIN